MVHVYVADVSLPFRSRDTFARIEKCPHPLQCGNVLINAFIDQLLNHFRVMIEPDFLRIYNGHAAEMPEGQREGNSGDEETDRITSYNVCYTKLLRSECLMNIRYFIRWISGQGECLISRLHTLSFQGLLCGGRGSGGRDRSYNFV